MSCWNYFLATSKTHLNNTSLIKLNPPSFKSYNLISPDFKSCLSTPKKRQFGSTSIKADLTITNSNIQSQLEQWPWITISTYFLKHISEISSNIICCIYIQNNNSSNSTIIYSHESNTDIGTILTFLIDLSIQTKCNVITYDYTGFGESLGIPSKENWWIDIDSVIEFYSTEILKTTRHNKLILMGKEIGCFPSLFTGRSIPKDTLIGIILINPIIEGFCFYNNINYAEDRFNIADNCENINHPVFIIANKETDWIKELIDKIKIVEKWWYSDNSKTRDFDIVMTSRDKFYLKLKTFIEQIRRWSWSSERNRIQMSTGIFGSQVYGNGLKNVKVISKYCASGNTYLLNNNNINSECSWTKKINSNSVYRGGKIEGSEDNYFSLKHIKIHELSDQNEHLLDYSYNDNDM